MISAWRIIHADRIRASAPAVVAILNDRKRRQKPSLLTRLGAREARVFFGILLRCYENSCALVAIPRAELILPQQGHKYEEAFLELTAAGVSERRIAVPTHKVTRGLTPRALVATLKALPTLLRCYRSHRLRPYAEVMAFAKAFTLILRSRKDSAYWLVVGDLSSFLIALTAACRCNGQRIIYWQYSYLDFKPLPVGVDVAVLLNETGRALARINPSTPSYWRPRDSVCPVRLNALDEGSIGAMLNVHADHRALERLDELARWLNRTLEVRLHPNSALDRCPWPETLTKANPAEQLRDFVRRHALLLGGNTQAQAKALTLGTPVVHCDGLDPLSFDHHGYVASGILPGCEYGKWPDMELIKSFFSSVVYSRALSGLMGPEPDDRRPALEAFATQLKTSANSGRGLPERNLAISPTSRQV